MAKGEQVAKPMQPPMEIREIAIDSIEIGPQMIRHNQDDDDVIELAGDVAARGLLQPIGVSPTTDNRFQLRWGSRRLAAFQRLRRATIPARICDPEDAAGIIGTALRENLLRRQLTLAEEIDAVSTLTNEGLAPAQISNLLGKSRNWVDRRLAFPQLPVAIRDHVIEGVLPLGHAEALATIDDPSAQSYLLAWTLGQRPSLAALRQSIEALTATPTFGQAVEEGTAAAQQASAPQPFYVGCHVCSTPTDINRLVIVRACKTCAQAMQGAGAPKDPDHAEQ